jgi:DNA-binding transcriptional ArsR family regulator
MLATFRALAEPSRLMIVDLLAAGPCSVNTVVEQLGMRQPQASKHLRFLSEAGLVEMRPHAQRRIYALRTEPLQELDLWLGRYRDLWEQQFQRLDEVLEEMKLSEKTRIHASGRTRRGAKKSKPV